MEKGIKPMEMNGNLAEHWRIWRQKFENYLIASETLKKSDEIKCAQLLHFLGDDALQIYNSFTFLEEEKGKFDILVKKFDQHFIPKKNLTYERYKFFKSRQAATESIEQFVTELKNQAKQCEFENLQDEMIKTMLITGLTDEILREKLLQHENKKLEDVIQACYIWENTKMQNRDMKNMKEVDNVKKYGSDDKKKFSVSGNKQHSTSTGNSSMTNNGNNSWTYNKYRNNTGYKSYEKLRNNNINCTKCGKYHVNNFKACPAQGKTCNICKKLNHFGIVCRNKNKNVNEINSTENCPEQNNVHKLSIDLVGNENIQSWQINLKIKEKNLNFKVDTGSDVNVINFSTFKTLNIDKSNITPTSEVLYDYSNRKIPVIGKCIILSKYKNVDYNIEYFIVAENCKLIIGLSTSELLGLINRVNQVQNINNEYENLTKHYKMVFEGIGKLGKPYTIEIKEGSQPVINPIRRVPFALETQFKNYLLELERLQIIEKVTGSTEWLNSFVIVKKPDGSLRICLDPKDLNNVIKRQNYKLPTIDEIMVNLKDSSIFTKLDATSGFWNVPLDEKSSKLCTFGTPMGRYRFKRLPFGIVTASEVFQERFKEIFNLTGVEIYIDDILIHGKTKEEHDERLKKVLEIAKKNNVKFNLEKCKFGLNEVVYLGYKFSGKGIMIDEEKIKAITDMPAPTNKKELQRFLGMVTYVGRFVKNLSEKTYPLRKMLKQQNSFVWLEEQDIAYKELIKILVSKPCLQIFDVDEEVVLSVDASKSGLGAVLMQKGLPCAYASKSMTETQMKYAQIEKELLGICFGVEKFHQYVYGRRITIESDHKPLISIFKKKLYDCPARLQRMLLFLQKYDINLIYKPGKELILADGLSRAYLKETYEEKMELETQICMITNNVEITDQRIQELVQLTQEDEELTQIKKFIVEGWPEKKNKIPDELKHYYKFRNEITQGMGLVFKGNKIIIPIKMRPRMLDNIHKGHFGINKCIQRANTALYWPKMNLEIENFVSKCSICQKYAKSNIKEPLILHKIENIPWYKLGMDIYELYGENYLLLVDYYSKYVEIENLNRNLTAKNVIEKLKTIFARHGIPAIIVTDSGTQLISKELQNFADDWKFKITPCSPHHQQANGQAERTIQTVKKLIKKTLEDKEDIYLALLTYRNTPVYDSYTPSQILMSRMLRDNVPRIKRQLQPRTINKARFHEKLTTARNRYKNYYDRHCKSRPEIENSDIYYQEKPNSLWKKGKIISREGERSYTIENESGRTIRRNKQFLKNRSNADDKFYRNIDIPIFDMFDDNVSDVPVDKSMPGESGKSTDTSQVMTRSGRMVIKPIKYRN